jgi:hypothetical protein
VVVAPCSPRARGKMAQVEDQGGQPGCDRVLGRRSARPVGGHHRVHVDSPSPWVLWARKGRRDGWCCATSSLLLRLVVVRAGPIAGVGIRVWRERGQDTILISASGRGRVECCRCGGGVIRGL